MLEDVWRRLDSVLVLAGPLALGAGGACLGVLGKQMTIGAATAAGWALWQVSMIAVVLWKVAFTPSG